MRQCQCFCAPCIPPLTLHAAEDSAAAVVPCGTCGRVGFCSSACAAAAAADVGSHCAAVCGLLAACNTAGLSDEQQTALQFLARCCALRQAAAAGDAAAAARCAAIAGLAAPPPLVPHPAEQQSAPGTGSNSSTDVVVRELHGRLSHALAAIGAGPAAALSPAEAAELLRKEATNGYGVMAPSAPDVSSFSRGVRF